MHIGGHNGRNIMKYKFVVKKHRRGEERKRNKWEKKNKIRQNKIKKPKGDSTRNPETYRNLSIPKQTTLQKLPMIAAPGI